jgi:hypothetical protein
MVTKSISLFGRQIFRVERNRDGQFTYTFLDGGNDFVDSDRYLATSLENPVLMAICAIRSSVYAQMEIKHVNSSGKVIENSPIVKLLKTPNYFQSQNDFFYQQMWFLSTSGTNLVYQQKAFSNELPKSIYNLIPSEVDLNSAHKVSKFITTLAEKKAFGERVIKYKLDNTEYLLKLSEIVPLYDLSNGLTNNSFFTSPSRVKGISRVLQNIDENLRSKNMNLKMSQKYLVQNKGDGNESQIQDDDRKDIYSKLERQSTIITNTSIDAKHLVSDMKRLYLDEQFADDANKCLLAFEMNKNILNYFAKDSTFENQNQGLISWVQNSIQTTATNTMNSLSQQWGLFDKGEKLIASYDHLAFMQSILNQKLTSFKELQEVIKLGIENGTITSNEAIKMSNEFKMKIGL